MATVQQSRTYNEIRRNYAWAEIDSPIAEALLMDAEDYIRAVYPVRSVLTEDEQRMFDGVVCRLAATFQTSPPSVATTAFIKKESKELAGMKKSVEYSDQSPDPYPYITSVMRAFTVQPRSSGGFTIARLVR